MRQREVTWHKDSRCKNVAEEGKKFFSFFFKVLIQNEIKEEEES